MLKRLLIPVVALGVLLAVSTIPNQATARPGPGLGWREVQALAPGQTGADATVRMNAADCQLLLKTHPDRTSSDCVNHYSLKVVRSKASARSDNLVLASFACGFSIESSMWNFLWWSYATVSFCWSSTYVYAWRVDCSNYGAYSGFSIAITWCGAGAQGTYAEGGDNVAISAATGGSYGAGIRIALDKWGNIWHYCWNAHC